MRVRRPTATTGRRGAHPDLDEMEAKPGAVAVELAEHHVSHGHGERSVGARVGSQPVVGELRVVGEVGRDHHDLLSPVAGLGHEVGVGRAGDGEVRPPDHQVGRVPPVGGLGHVGLVAEDLGGGRRQVGVPVVEGKDRPAEQRAEARARGVRGHRHGGDHRKGDRAIRAIGRDSVDMGGGNHLEHLGPAGAHEAAASTSRLVGAGALGIVDELRPAGDRVATVGRLGVPVQLEEHTTHVGVADTGR